MPVQCRLDRHRHAFPPRVLASPHTFIHACTHPQPEHLLNHHTHNMSLPVRENFHFLKYGARCIVREKVCHNSYIHLIDQLEHIKGQVCGDVDKAT